MAKTRKGSAARKVAKKTVKAKAKAKAGKKAAAKKSGRKMVARSAASAGPRAARMAPAAGAAVMDRSLSVGPIWRAIEAFEDAARAVQPQPPEIAEALASLERAKEFIPACARQADGEFEFILLR